MTILEPILYANGALRLTRHGAGKGGNVLVLEVDGKGTTQQVELTDEAVDWFERLVAKYREAIEEPIAASDASTLFKTAAKHYSTQSPGFYHD